MGIPRTRNAAWSRADGNTWSPSRMARTAAAMAGSSPRASGWNPARPARASCVSRSSSSRARTAWRWIATRSAMSGALYHGARRARPRLLGRPEARIAAVDESDFEGTLVLEQLAAVGSVEDFFDAVDSDDIE